MDKIDEAIRREKSPRAGHAVAIILQCILVILLLCTGLTGWIHWSLILSTLLGMLIAAVGGIAIGITAQRFLGHSRNNLETFVGLAATVGIGVLTIGYLYIIHIKNPMGSIGTLPRTVEQTVIFLEFLLSQISGIKLADHIFQ
jgi:hypothetical protein